MDPSPAPSSGPVPPPPLLLEAWPRSSQLATAFLLCVAVTLLAWMAFDSWRVLPLELHRAVEPTVLSLPAPAPADVPAETVRTAIMPKTPTMELRGGGKEQELRGIQININKATVEELQHLPGIGPKLAQRIVDERELRGLFRTVDDLRRVSGIGVKTLERLRPHVTVSSRSTAGL